MLSREQWEPLLLNKWSAFVHDVFWVPWALLLAYWLRMGLADTPPELWNGYFALAMVATILHALTFKAFGLYRGIWRFASVPDIMRILRAVWFAAVLVALLTVVFMPQSWRPALAVFVLYPMVLTMAVTGPRLLYRWFKDFYQPSGTRRRALIIGAGWSGGALARELIRSRDYLPVGFLDDDPAKQGRDLHGVPVLGGLDELDYRLRELDLQIVLIAMARADAALMRHIVDTAAHYGIPCVTLPCITSLSTQGMYLSRLREVEIDDLLGRDEVQGDAQNLRELLTQRRVLVTGAGGSIGSELCRQVARFLPAQLLMLDHSEYSLYTIDADMRKNTVGVPCIPLLGDVTDPVRMQKIFSAFRPEIVLHAAAYKHVPLLEDNAIEGVRVNVLGTQLVADLAAVHGCEKFVLVSTDKAVRPTNIMGASKRVAELYCQSLRAPYPEKKRTGTAYIVTRFGNVMGSTGSVVPLFRKQIAEGGPVTVTHPEITRYFMTISEAVGLILQAAAMGRGGEVYVLDMGQPIKIQDLAEEMIRLSGHEPGRDIQIRHVGLRPGEKLHEELFHDHENPVGTLHPKIMQAQVSPVASEWIHPLIKQLERSCAVYDAGAVRTIIREMVPDLPYAAAKTAECVAATPIRAVVEG